MSNNQCLTGNMVSDLPVSGMNLSFNPIPSGLSVDFDSYKIVMQKKEEKPIPIVVNKRVSGFKLISFLSFAFVFSVGVLDISAFLFSGSYFVHPYFALIITIFSGSLLLTSFLHSIGH